MIVGASGGRDYELTSLEGDVFLHLLRLLGATEFWHGGCRGVDTKCAELARVAKVSVRQIRAPWERLGPVGDLQFGRNDAGPLRNWYTAREVRSAGGGTWIFFPGGIGTADMLQQCRAHAIATVDLRRGLSNNYPRRPRS